MKAALLIEINKPLVMTDLSPCILKPGQVLVRVLVSGICGAQLSEIRGEKGTHFPRLMGHEGCGIVEYAGPGVTKVKQGQKVVMHWRKGSGMESESPRYYLGDEEITGGQVTTFSDYSICSENRLTAVPGETPNELCALLGCGLSTSLGVMENEAKLKAGESVLIVGCGGVGLNLIRVARMMGASRIVGRDSMNMWKHMRVTEAGADDSECIFGGGCPEKFDVVIDTSGSPQAISLGIERVKGGGTFVMVGQPKPESEVVIPNARHLFDGEGKTVKATQGGGFNPDKDLPRYINMWRSGHMKIEGVITHRFPFAQINEAIATVQTGNAGRAILEMV